MAAMCSGVFPNYQDFKRGARGEEEARLQTYRIHSVDIGSFEDEKAGNLILPFIASVVKGSISFLSFDVMQRTRSLRVV